jgi:hypothetical protein
LARCSDRGFGAVPARATVRRSAIATAIRLPVFKWKPGRACVMYGEMYKAELGSD